MVIELRNSSFGLLPERAVYWSEKQYLIISDLHLGKTSYFRSKGLAAPEGGDNEDLERLSGLLNKTGAKRLIILGDLIHSRYGNAEVIKGFLQQIIIDDLIVVKGNHDRISAENELLGEKLKVFFEEDNFIFSHSPFKDESGMYVLAGHIHPAVNLKGKGRHFERVPCFYFTEDYGVLPSFGSFTGSFVISPKENDRVFIPADDKVLEVSMQQSL
jgi:DNA ligase-associated metallophosphoesterase